MKRNIPGRLIESILLVPTWIFAIVFCGCYLVGSVSRDMARSFITIWRE